MLSLVSNREMSKHIYNEIVKDLIPTMIKVKYDKTIHEYCLLYKKEYSQFINGHYSEPNYNLFMSEYPDSTYYDSRLDFLVNIDSAEIILTDCDFTYKDNEYFVHFRNIIYYTDDRWRIKYYENH